MVVQYCQCVIAILIGSCCCFCGGDSIVLTGRFLEEDVSLSSGGVGEGGDQFDIEPARFVGRHYGITRRPCLIFRPLYHGKEGWFGGSFCMSVRRQGSHRDSLVQPIQTKLDLFVQPFSYRRRVMLMVLRCRLTHQTHHRKKQFMYCHPPLTSVPHQRYHILSYLKIMSEVGFENGGKMYLKSNDWARSISMMQPNPQRIRKLYMTNAFA
mmetsp:Transcript_15787/g.28710  ORF Transcript_15787/g.28710 Transcript_15787/m.28710 type:complete len:210 (+) Transcript_15787:274-903(+)